MQLTAEAVQDLQDGLAHEVHLTSQGDAAKRVAFHRLKFATHAGSVYTPIILVEGDATFGSKTFLSETSAKDTAEAYARATANMYDESRPATILWTVARWTEKPFTHTEGTFPAVEILEVHDITEDALPVLI